MSNRKHDYIRLLFGGEPGVAFSYPANTKRILRKLVREAVHMATDYEVAGLDLAEIKRYVAKELIP